MSSMPGGSSDWPKPGCSGANTVEAVSQFAKKRHPAGMPADAVQEHDRLPALGPPWNSRRAAPATVTVSTAICVASGSQEDMTADGSASTMPPYHR